ncbi:MAG: hypothetical protein ACLQVM_00110, partial [Terriglobia bacterium]
KTEGLVKRKIRMRICLGTTRVRESELQKEVAQFKSWGCGIAACGLVSVRDFKSITLILVEN